MIIRLTYRRLFHEQSLLLADILKALFGHLTRMYLHRKIGYYSRPLTSVCDNKCWHQKPVFFRKITSLTWTILSVCRHSIQSFSASPLCILLSVEHHNYYYYLIVHTELPENIDLLLSTALRLPIGPPYGLLHEANPTGRSAKPHSSQAQAKQGDDLCLLRESSCSFSLLYRQRCSNGPCRIRKEHAGVQAHCRIATSYWLRWPHHSRCSLRIHSSSYTDST